jgi:altronate dehydratase
MREEVKQFDEIGRLPQAGDNVAIATRRLEPGTRIARGATRFVIAHTVLEGHRFAVEPIPEGQALLSWGLPFGHAIADLAPGDYACNEKILRVLREREAVSLRRDGAEPDGTHDQGPGRVPGGFRPRRLHLPEAPTFRDAELVAYELDEETFTPGEPVALHAEVGTFLGYRRAGGRGVGTRNLVVVMAVTSRTSSFASALAERLRSAADAYENVDGVVSLAHTEGGEDVAPNNLEILLRTLSGFVVHPNVGAVLIVDEEAGAVDGGMLRAHLEEHGYPLEHIPHAFMRLGGSFGRELARGEAIVRGWLGRVNETARTREPLSQLKLALQCGGSDAFSGVSANPLVGWVAKEVIRHGGGAILAETDELIGAEPYVLANVRDLETARRFLAAIARFKELVGWHGHTAEGNPSGGNNYRGLYNISIKSIGAAAKRDPEVRVEHVIEYAERMRGPGLHFMDSPGNDLESVAGEVASGCNLIFFTTGNGSITNNSLVPTIKVVSTTGRYDLLPGEMDVNAGAYLDGVPMDELGRATFALGVRVASGERSAGERAGHSQVQIWRDWKQTGPGEVARILSAPVPDGEPLAVAGDPEAENGFFAALEGDRGPATDQVGLLLPTSLCSSQVALAIARSLAERDCGRGRVTGFVALPHTEGCGNSGGVSLDLYTRTMLGYLEHPRVRFALLLEHGCEKTHNDYFRARMTERGLDPERFGWASIQLDGGIERVTGRVERWFAEALETADELGHATVGLEHLRVGLISSGPVADEAARSLAALTRLVVGAGGTVVIPATATLLAAPAYVEATLQEAPRTTLAYGEGPRRAGLHVMEAPSTNPAETATGLGAAGVELMLAHVTGRPLPSHRMIPILQASADPATLRWHGEDLDVALSGDAADWPATLLDALLAVASRRLTPTLHAQGNVGFQVTRGLLGVSM